MPVHLLWTGGWDSTYRLLYLVVCQGRAVVPHYMVDPGREGAAFEQRAMDAIRRAAAQDFPGREHLIAPTIVTPLASIPADPEITGKFTRLRATAKLGTQYEILARYIAANRLAHLELGIHLDDRAEAFVRPFVERDGDAYRIRHDAAGDDI